jgi:hypothetical protein
MDPISTTAAAVGLATALLNTAKSLSDLRDKYASASLSLSSLASECTILSGALIQVGQQIQNDQHGFKTKVVRTQRAVTDGDLVEVPLDLALQEALITCEGNMRMLNEGIKKHNSRNISGLLSFKTKTKFLWAEAELRERLRDLRGVSQALSFLLTAIQA